MFISNVVGMLNRKCVPGFIPFVNAAKYFPL